MHPSRPLSAVFPSSSAPGPAQWMRWLAVAVLLAAYPAQKWLAPEAAWENSWIENTQVAVLLGGLLMAALWARRARGGDARLAALCRAAMVLWAILAARELSWGGAFLPPVGFTDQGPFYSSRELWYKPAVHPALALLLAYAGYCVVRFRLDRLVIGCARSFWLEGVLIFAGMALSTCAEGHGPRFLGDFLGGNPLVVEEWAELAAYFALVAAQAQVLAVVGQRGIPSTESPS